jgi:hypothetical protein
VLEMLRAKYGMIDFTQLTVGEVKRRVALVKAQAAKAEGKKQNA